MSSPILRIRPAEPPLTDAVLCAWLGDASPGDAITYHRGALARDICPQLNLLDQAERVRLARLAGRAHALAEAGLLHLVQRRQAARRIGGFADLDGLEFVAKIEHGTDAGGETKNEIRMAVTPDHRDYAQAMGRIAAPAGYAPPPQPAYAPPAPAYAPPAAPAMHQGAFPAPAQQPAPGTDPRPAWAR